MALRSGDLAQKQAAVAALRLAADAITPATSADDRILWRMRLGAALSDLAVKTNSIETSQEALAIMHNVETMDHVDNADFYSDYAQVYSEYALILAGKGRKEESIAGQERSVELLIKAAARIDRATKLRFYLQTQFNIAYVLGQLADLRESVADAQRSAEAAKAALPFARRDHNPFFWAILEMRYGDSLIKTNTYGASIDEATVARGLAALNSAAEVLTKAAWPTFYTDLEYSRGMGLAIQARRHPSAAAFDPAIAAFREAAAYYTKDSDADSWADAKIRIAGVLIERGTVGADAEKRASFDEAKALLAEVAPTVEASANSKLKALYTTASAALKGR